MHCHKCRAEIPDGSVFCNRCGAKQSLTQRPKGRGNGQGSVYQLPNKSWIAVRVIGYSIDGDGHRHKRTVSKSGFKTKREAVAYLPQLAVQQPAQKREAITLGQLYERWEPTHRAGASTMGCYHAAWHYFQPLQMSKLSDIDIDDLQDCMDTCPKGKRTRQNMKALCGLLYKYAIPRHLATLNLAPYLIVGDGEDSCKVGLPLEAVEALRASIGIIPYADYIIAQCYLGFRPSELLSLDVADYDRKQRCFVGGAKTEAGKDRTVPISPKIQPIIDRLVYNRIAGPVFCGPDGKPLSIKAYREAFYAALDTIGWENPIWVDSSGQKRRTYTPHSCRHTFATLLKEVKAPDQDKLRLIGHTSTEMLRHYQDVDLDALRRITDAL